MPNKQEAMQSDEDAWKIELERLNSKNATLGGWVAIITYTGGLSTTEFTYHLSPLEWAYIFLPMVCILAAFTIRKLVGLGSNIFSYVIVLSLTLSNALLLANAPSTTFNNILLSIVAIYVTSGLFITWKTHHSFIVVLTGWILNLCLLVGWKEYPFLFWLGNWTILFPIGLGMVALIWFKYNNLKHNFFITRALNRANEDLEKKNRDMLSSINYAKRIQNAMLPLHEKMASCFADFFVLFRPRDIVSGDFYWFAELGDKVVWVVADCTGHGVPGAFMSLIGINFLEEAVLTKDVQNPSIILQNIDIAIRSALKQDESSNRDGMEMGVCVWNKKTNTVSYAGAMLPLYYHIGNELITIKADRKPLGGHTFKEHANSSFTTHTIHIESPTVFYLGSDGFGDQFGGSSNQKFSTKRLKELISTIALKPLSEQKNLLSNSLDNWMEQAQEKQVDDILLLGIKIERTQS